MYAFADMLKCGEREEIEIVRRELPGPRVEHLEELANV
jgi:hypothetical protein